MIGAMNLILNASTYLVLQRMCNLRGQNGLYNVLLTLHHNLQQVIKLKNLLQGEILTCSHLQEEILLQQLTATEHLLPQAVLHASLKDHHDKVQYEIVKQIHEDLTFFDFTVG